MKYFYIIISLVLLVACKNKSENSATMVESTVYPKVGQIERIDDRINSIIPEHATIERIATGLTWAEGPLWIDSKKMLLCSDVKKDKIYNCLLYTSPSPRDRG